MKTLTFLIVIVCLLITGCNNKNRTIVSPIHSEAETTSGEIVISGAYALYPLAEIWKVEFQRQFPNIQIEIKKTGTGQGLKDIFNGAADLAMVSRNLNPEENKDSLWFVAVARCGVVTVINAKNPFYNELMKTGLNIAGLQEIFTSEEKVHWNKYIKGAADREIVVYSRADDSGAAEVFSNFLNYLQNDLTGIKLEGDDAMIQHIRQDIYSIGFCNANYVFDLENGKVKEGLAILPIDLNFNGRVDTRETIPDSLYLFQRHIWTLKFPRNLCRSFAKNASK